MLCIEVRWNLAMHSAWCSFYVGEYGKEETMNIKGKKICDNCFYDIKNEPCSNCGYKKSQYHPEAGILPVGTVLKQRYHIGLVLGRGGFGVTYKAYDMQMEKIVAIKEYYPNGIAHRDTGTTQMTLTDATQKESFNTGAEKFFEEAKTVSRFNGNPNIVSVYEFFYENSTVYYVMEYLEGCDLKHYIKEQGGKISEEQVMTILNVITDALFITHNLNVMHRDISPDNIYISRNGEVKLIDFGAARQVIAEQSKSLSVILKQGFAPLEQYQRKGKQGPWTDIYALGATCLYALTGKVPDDATERIENPSIGEAVEYGIDEKLWKVLEKCLSVRTVDRYQSVLELKEALKEIDIVPAPFILAEKEEIPLTVAVSGDYNVDSNLRDIQATVAVGMEMGPVYDATTDNKEEKKSTILLFLKSTRGIIVIAAILVVIIVAVAGTVIVATSRGKDSIANNNGGNNVVNNSTEQTESADDTGSESITDDSQEYNTEGTEERNTETESQNPVTEEPTPQPPASEEPAPQPPASETPTPQPPASEEPTPQPSESEEPETSYVENVYCATYADVSIEHDSQMVRANYGYYTGEWKNNAPNGKGYFIFDEDDGTVNNFAVRYIYYGTWADGVFHGEGTRVYVRFNKRENSYPTINTVNWIPYMSEEVSFEVEGERYATSEVVSISTGTWINGNEGGSNTAYYGNAIDGYRYYTLIDGSKNNATKYSWDGHFLLE